MSGFLLFLATIASPAFQPPPPVPAAMEKFQPTTRATARANATIRILSGAKFGHGRKVEAAGATQRTARVEGAPGTMHPAQLLEFQ